MTLSPEALFFLLSLDSCIGGSLEPHAVFSAYCKNDADHLPNFDSCVGVSPKPKTVLSAYCETEIDHHAPCPLLDTFYGTLQKGWNWRDHVGMGWDDWHNASPAVRASWLYRHLLFSFFCFNGMDLDIYKYPGAVAICARTIWLVPSSTRQSFGEIASLASPLPTHWCRSPEVLRDVFTYARAFRRGGLVTFDHFLQLAAVA